MKHSRKILVLIVSACLVAFGLAIGLSGVAHASGGISKDSSTPASVLKTNSTSTTETTASFSPPANSFVVINFDVEYDHNTTSSPTVTVSDSNSVSYTAGPHTFDNAADGSFIFTHYYATAPGSVTVTVTRSGQTGAAMLETDPSVLDGVNSSQSGAASATKEVHGATAYTVPITSTESGSVVFATASVADAETLTAHNLSNFHTENDANDGSSAGTGTSTTTSPGAETIGWTGSANAYYSIAALEILPAPASLPPAVVSQAATSVGNTTATLNGTVNPEGQSTTYQFDYGPTTSYGSSVPSPAGSAGSGSSAVPESYNLTGLTAGDTYHYRIEATNATGTTYGSDEMFTDTGGGTLLTWSPPACGGSDGDTCTTINITNSNLDPTLASNVDYKLDLPSTPITGGTLVINGGHNVQIIGGEVDLVNPCSDSCSAQGDGAIYITDGNAGEVYIEGVLIHNNDYTADSGSSCSGGGETCSTADGIDVNVGDGGNPTTPPTVVLQNIRVDGISGCSGGSDHADVLQPYNAGTATIDVDHLTGTTNCQGMTLDPDYGYQNFGTEPTYNLKNVNIDVFNNPYSGDNDRYGYWLTYHTSCPSGAISLSNVYEQEPDGTLAANSVWPDTSAGGGPSGCLSSWSSPTLSFPNSSQITGDITEGLPPGGDYVPTGVAGIGYTSPGYLP